MGRWLLVRSVDEVPERGCYAVYHDGELVYIGSSMNLPGRVAHYLRPPTRRRKPIVNGGARRRQAEVVTTMKVSGWKRRGDWLMREYRLIDRLRPRDNRMFTGTTRPRIYVPSFEVA